MNILPSREELHRFFRYDPETGKLYWKVSKQGIKSNFEVGSVNRGYVSIKIDGKNYFNHRIIMKMFSHNFDDSMQVDHIDGNRSNNRLNNLRMVTPQENSKNQKIRKDNTTGETGVYLLVNGRWRVQIMVNQKYISGGCYKNFEDAIKARDELYEKHGFHANHGRKISV